MSRIIAQSSIPVKATRHSARKPGRFGAGVFPKPVRFSPSPTEAAWAAQAFSDGPEPDWDTLAMEAGYEALHEQGVAAGERCSLCGATDALTAGMCERCIGILDVDLELREGICAGCAYADDFIDPATNLCPACTIRLETSQEDASQAALYGSAGLGFRSN